jgi:5-methylcytosine-specific restriction endonuclease McrA
MNTKLTYKERKRISDKKYYLKNREKIRAQAKVYASKNKEKIKEYKDQYYLEHKEELMKKALKWCKDNPEKRKAISKRDNDKRAFLKRRWTEKKQYGESITTIGAKCYLCGMGYSTDHSRCLAIHHIDGNNGDLGKPLNNDPDNLIVLCVSCHAKVHSRWVFKNVYEYR